MTIRPWADLKELDRAWDAFPVEAVPLGADVRRLDPGTWVRFHTLPSGKRIPRSDAERAEVMHRYLAVLGALANPGLVTTVGWEGVSPPVPAALWRSVPGDPALSVYASGFDKVVDLIPLLEMVAEDRAPDVIVTRPDFSWMAHPYDGGIDVVGEFPQTLARRFRGWRSPRSDGL